MNHRAERCFKIQRLTIISTYRKSWLKTVLFQITSDLRLICDLRQRFDVDNYLPLLSASNRLQVIFGMNMYSPN